jgi:N-acetylglutamate synthase-like GNAT family acetyltransferase
MSLITNRERIERALTEDHLALTELTKKSKAFWKYDEQQMKEWTNCSITPEYILNNETYKLVLHDKIVGYYSLTKISPKTAMLDNLFVSPEFIRNGFGKRLVADVLKKAAESQYSSIIFHSDPYAELFYKNLGFIKTGEVPTAAKDRFLPIMQIPISGPA